MSQTFTSQIELNVLHTSEHIHTGLTETAQSLSHKNSPRLFNDRPTNAAEENPPRGSGFRIGNVFIEDKVIILLGVGFVQANNRAAY